jgi:hypothetical protein
MGQIQSDGQGGYVFTGAHAKQFYYNNIGTNIPLEPVRRCHFAAGVRSVTADGWPSLLAEDHTPFRSGFSELEFGVLQDLGYVITPVPKASFTSLTASNSNLNLRVDGLIPYLQCYLSTNVNLIATNGWANVQVVVPTGSAATASVPIPPGVNQLFFGLRR